MSTKHTPGPWRLGGHPRDDSGTDWREVLTMTEFGPAYVCQALKADARLIAAAPDLLAALEELRTVIARDLGPEFERNLPACERARAAIARATGDASC